MVASPAILPFADTKCASVMPPTLPGILFAKTLSTLKKVANGKASSVIITKDTMESSGALREDTEGFIEYITNIKDVEIAILFLELKGNKVKVSL